MNINFQPTKQQYEMVEAVVTNVTRTGSSFAKHMETDRDIYINRATTEAAELKMGDKIVAMVVTSRDYLMWTPESGRRQPAELFARFVTREDDEVDQEQQEIELEATHKPNLPPLRTRIMELLQDGPVTASFVRDALGGDVKIYHAFDTLTRLHREGLIYRASIKATPDQEAASRVVWARSLDELTPVRVQE